MKTSRVLLVASTGYRIDAERSRRELVGSAGARANLFVLLERAESDALDGDAQ